MQETEKLTLTNLAEGAALEKFGIALQKVLENIKDINTTLGAREINLKVTLTPSEHRDYVGIKIACPVKLATQEAVSTTANLTIDSRGRAVAHERKSRQIPLVADNVSNMEEKHVKGND